jgi:cell division protein FtsB
MNRRTLTRGERVALALLIVAVVALCGAALVPGARELHKRSVEIERLRTEKHAAEQRLADLNREKSMADTDEWIERVARDDLHLAKPDEVIYDFSRKPATSGTAAGQAPDERSPE